VQTDEDTDEPRRYFAPDVRVIERPGSSRDPGGVATMAGLADEPLIVPRTLEPETLRCIQIIDTKSSQRVITSIEFLSPANKTTEEGRRQYVTKQKHLLEGGINLVEIDLLRSGSWVLAVPQRCVPEAYRAPYRICVVRGENPSVAEVYRVSLQVPLPTIKIPLRTSDKDGSLNLQALIDLTYANGGYEDIDYRQDATPPLTGTDATWGDALLRQKSAR
jgi:hypothetical protein